MKTAFLAATACLCIGAGAATVARAQDAPTPTPAPAASVDYGALKAQSAALTPARRAQAQSLFATSFSLWKSGDFAAAEIGFKQGLDIDPANALANYYYGDCLARRKDKAEAKVYLARAAAFDNSTAEGLKAQAELQALMVAPTDVAEMSNQEIASILLGVWSLREVCSYGSDVSKFIVQQIDSEQGTFSAKLDGCRFESGRVNASDIRFSCNRMGNHISYSGTIKSPTEMDGNYIQDVGQCRWFGTKN